MTCILHHFSNKYFFSYLLPKIDSYAGSCIFLSLLPLFNYLLIYILSFSTEHHYILKLILFVKSIQQLSAQLGDLQNVTDPATRRDLQSSVLRSGALLHNLGSLLLELGRTTMLLRINPASVGFVETVLNLFLIENYLYFCIDLFCLLSVRSGCKLWTSSLYISIRA